MNYASAKHFHPQVHPITVGEILQAMEHATRTDMDVFVWYCKRNESTRVTDLVPTGVAHFAITASGKIMYRNCNRSPYLVL